METKLAIPCSPSSNYLEDFGAIEFNKLTSDVFFCPLRYFKPFWIVLSPLLFPS